MLYSGEWRVRAGELTRFCVFNIRFCVLWDGRSLSMSVEHVWRQVWGRRGVGPRFFFVQFFTFHF